MMNYDDITENSYDATELRRQLRKGDFWKYKIDPHQVENIIDTISTDFVLSKFDVQSINRQFFRGKSVYIMVDLYDVVTIRRTNEILKKTIKYYTPTREDEIKQLWEIIKTEGKRSWIFRTDIVSFFENLSFDSISSRMMSEGIICPSTYMHLKSISKRLQHDGYKGLPRGLPVSSSMMEFAMIDFDRSVRKMEKCIYYSRYVDDILVVTSDEVTNIKEKIEKLLPFDMSLNLNKTQYEKLESNKRIDFLGFSFPLIQPFEASISARKINKIKKRIVLSIRKFLNYDHNFKLLIERLQFLTGITSLCMASRKKQIAVGFRYQYSLCNESVIMVQLKQLDTFLRSILASKRYSLAKKMRNKVSNEQYNNLCRISFSAGYEHCMTHRRNRLRISKIKDAWHYE